MDRQHVRLRMRSVEQPAPERDSKRRRTTQNAGQPVQEPAGAKVAFIACESTITRMDSRSSVEKLILAVECAVQNGADFIGIALKRVNRPNTASEILSNYCILNEDSAHYILWKKMKDAFDELNVTMRNSIVHEEIMCFVLERPGGSRDLMWPADGFTTLDPEGGFPAIVVTLCGVKVITASWPNMPLRAQRRTLQAYLDYDVGPCLVGVNVDTNRFFMDNVAANGQCQAMINGDLAISASCDMTVNLKQDFTVLTAADPCMALVSISAGAEQPGAEQSGAEQSGAEQSGAPEEGQKLRHTAKPKRGCKKPNPFYDSFCDSLHTVQNEEVCRDILEYISEKMFYGDLCHRDEWGNKLHARLSVADKMETFLRTVTKQRILYINELKTKRDPRVCEHEFTTVLNSLQFTQEDMRTILNTWRASHYLWMNPTTQERYWSSWWYHSIEKSAFSTHLHNISGCKFLLHKLIELPVLHCRSNAAGDCIAKPGSVADASVLQTLLRAWESHRESAEHQHAIHQSQPNRDGRARLSKRLWEAHRDYSEGAQLAHRVKTQRIDEAHLSERLQALLQEFRSGFLSLRFQDALDEQIQRETYAGAGVVVSIEMPRSVEQPAPASVEDVDDDDVDDDDL